MLRNKPVATPVRYKQEFFQVALRQVDFFGVSPIQMISLATSLIPFLEHDDANRALMGSNMQRQAVPLLSTERPYVGTGLEIQAARDSTTLSISPTSGQIQYVDALSISIVNRSVVQNRASYTDQLANPVPGEANDRAGKPSRKSANDSTLSNKKFQLKVQKYWRSNQSTWLQSTPQVRVGDWVDAGDLLTDGAASAFGEIALGKNILVAYLPWEGYNFEDAIVINQRLVTEDIYTSIHIERYDVDTKETEYGKEQIIRPNLANKTIHRLTELEPGLLRNKPVQGEAKPVGSGGSPVHVNGFGTGRQVQVVEPGLLVGLLVAKQTHKQTNKPVKPPKTLPDSRSAQTRAHRSMRSNPNPDPFHLETNQLDERGIVFPGSWVKENDILVGKITPIAPVKPTPEYRLLLAIFEAKPLPFKDTSLRLPIGVQGRVLECILDPDPASPPRDPLLVGLLGAKQTNKESTLHARASRSDAGAGNQNNRLVTGLLRSKPGYTPGSFGSGFGIEQSSNPMSNLEPASWFASCEANQLPYQAIQSAQIFVASKRKIQLGDKMSGRHGNKGIVSLILPAQDMPFLPDGTPVDIVLNPLGVPSRMNVGQVLECLFGFASKYLKQNYRILPFDESNGADTSRGIVYQKLFEAASLTGKKWLFDPNHPGKIHLCDGRTGEHFHQPILVGYSYILKLIHQVDEKMHARSTGPYSLITQQPLGGRSKHGGQRLGEMEVWALEGFGSASILHEFLTLKSDDIDSRNTFLFYLMKRKSTKIPGSNYSASCSPDCPRLQRANDRASQTNKEPVANEVEWLESVTGAKPKYPVNHLAPSQLEGWNRRSRFKRSSSSDPLHRFLNDRFALLQTPAQSGSTDQQESTVPESFRVLVHELQALCLSVYFNPEFRLTYPSLLGWDGLFFIPSKD